MNIDDLFSVDKEAFEDGKWFDLGPDSKIKMRSFKSPKAKAARTRLELPYKSLLRTGKELPEDISEDIATKQMAEAIIVDWKGLSTDEGPLPKYSADYAYKFLSEKTEFRDYLAQILFDSDAFKSEDREQSFENLKNS